MPTIEAQIMKVQHDDTGWYRIFTDHDRIKRLDTKLEEKAREAVALKREGGSVVIEFTSKPRTLEDGRTFQNYYYEKAVSAAGNGGGEDEIERVATPARKTDPGDAWRMTLGLAAKVVVASLPWLDARGVDTSFTAQREYTLAWATWLISTPQPAATPAPVLGGDASDFDPPAASSSFPDDDIPF